METSQAIVKPGPSNTPQVMQTPNRKEHFEIFMEQEKLEVY